MGHGCRDLAPRAHRALWSCAEDFVPEDAAACRAHPDASLLPGCAAPLAAVQRRLLLLGPKSTPAWCSRGASLAACPALLRQDLRGRMQHRARRPSLLCVAATALSRHTTHLLLAAKRHRAPSRPAPTASAADTHKGNPQPQPEPFKAKGTARIVFLCTQSNLGKQEAHKGD